MLRRIFLAALIVATQTASLVAAPMRGRAFDAYFQLTNISDGADVTSGTVTVKVSKDGAAQATATNAASHLGQGQWKVTLTAAEMTAATVGLSVAESGSYSINQTIPTEPAKPPIRKVFKYDGELTGDLLGTFTRSVATVDGAGLPVAANERRFDGTTRAIAGLCDWHATPYVAGTTPYLMASGEDLDGDKLLVINETASNTIRVVEIDDVRLTASEVSRTAYTAFPGAGGGVTMAPRSAQVIDGTVIIQCQRNNSSTVTGMALAYSQNAGSTWTAINTAAADGGAAYMPAPASYSTSADANDRGGFWSTSWTPHGGLDAAGRPKSMTRVWLTNWDYLQGGAAAKGYDGGVVELTRASEDVHFTVGVNRRLLSGYSTGYTSNLHIHMIGMTGDGMFIAAMGDSNGKTNVRAVDIDLDNYATATPTVTEVFGELAASGTAGRMAPQIFGGVPGPDGKIICGNDSWHSPILTIDNMSSAASTFVLDSPDYVPDDLKTGDYFAGWENFNTRYGGPGYGWITGPDGRLTSPKNWLRYFSRDGRHWAMLTATDGLTGQALIVGDCLATIHDSSDALYLCKTPEVRTRRSLMVAPALDNYLHNTSNLYQAAPPTGSNTLELVLYSGGRYIFADDSTAVPNAPKVPPPYNNAILYHLGNQNMSSYEHGWVTLPDTGDTAFIDSNLVGVTCSVANLGSNATGWFVGRVGKDGIGNNCTAFTGFKPDRSASAKNSWHTTPIFGKPVNNGITTSRSIMQLLSGPSSGTANKDCPMLVAVGGLYVTATGITPWPCPRDSTGNPNEYESLAITPSPSASSAWKGTVSLIRSSEQATIGSSLPSGTLCTWWRDANNYVTIAIDGPNWEIDVISTVAGSTADTESIAIEDWIRGTALNISVTDDGAGNVYASLVSPRNGVQTTPALTAASIGYPTQFRVSDAAQSATYNIMVAGGEIQDQYLTLEQMRAEHVSLSYLDTDADRTAATVAAKVDAELDNAFAGVPADVWLQDISRFQKLESTGLTLADALAEATDALKPTVLGRTLGVESDGDLTKVNTLDGHTAQTGDAFARIGVPATTTLSADLAVTTSTAGSTLTQATAAAANTAASALRSAMGLASNNLDTQLAAKASQASVDPIATATGTTIPNLIGTPAVNLAADIAGLSLGANPNVLLTAEIAVINSQTSFTLATGADFDDAYNGQAIVLYDDSNSDFPSVRVILDYVGSTKTVTIDGAPAFTLAATDSVAIFATAPGTTAPTVAQIRTEMDANSTKLANLDAAMSTRASATQATTIDNKIGTPADTLADDIAGVSSGGGLDAAGVRAALGMTSANMDTQLTAKPSLSQILNGTAAEGFFANQPGAEGDLTPEQIGDIVEGLVEAGAAAAPIAPITVSKARTWVPDQFDPSRAANIITIKGPFAKTLAAELPLNDDGDLAAIASVTCTPPSGTVTPNNFQKTGDGRTIHFDVGTLTTVGTYIFDVTGTTVDDQTISMRCKLVLK